VLTSAANTRPEVLFVPQFVTVVSRNTISLNFILFPHFPYEATTFFPRSITSRIIIRTLQHARTHTWVHAKRRCSCRCACVVLGFLQRKLCNVPNISDRVAEVAPQTLLLPVVCLPCLNLRATLQHYDSGYQITEILCQGHFAL
jgi:hypothetical protein